MVLCAVEWAVIRSRISGGEVELPHQLKRVEQGKKSEKEGRGMKIGE
jgi:hypothetical protein